MTTTTTTVRGDTFHPPYSREHVEIIAEAEHDGSLVTIVRAHRFDTWLGVDRDDQQNMGGTNTEHTARWYAGNWSPSLRPERVT